MRRPDIGKVVYNFIWQDPRDCDPVSWEDFTGPNGRIVKEVQEERLRFYGPPPNPRIPNLGYPLEAQYPGMDYNNPWHRMRLSIGRWHKILFKALDTLELTPDEIDSIMTFKGTKFERQQYERQHGVVVRDTTGDELKPFVEPFLVLRKSSALVSRMLRRTNSETGSVYTIVASPQWVLNLDEDPPDPEANRVEEEDLDTELSQSSEECEDENGSLNVEETEANPTPPQPAPPRSVYHPRSFEEFLDQRHPQDQPLNGPSPTPYRVLHTVDEILIDDINETVRFGIGFSNMELEYWREHAREHGHQMCNEGTWGFGLWRIPRHVSRVFFESKGDTSAALEKISQVDFYNQEDPRAITDYLVACLVEEDDDDEDSDMSDEEQPYAPRPTSMPLDLDADDEDDDCEDSDMNDQDLPHAPHFVAAPVHLDTDEEADGANDMDGDVVIDRAHAAAQLRGLVTPADVIRSMARRVGRSSSDPAVVLRQNNDRTFTHEHTGARHRAAHPRQPTIRASPYPRAIAALRRQLTIHASQ